ncbi:TniQ family protein [Pseudomonas sp. ME-P-057]|uniref:TniQ family protein n=1 Tax=Pseudomonas sp. ME-P-057 TaxID=3040321 RepID=UPI003306BCAF
MILPIHTQPKSDEILSSWLVRLALCNRLPIHTFYRSLLGYRGEIWTRDIDRHPSLDLLETLSDVTSLPVLRLKNLSLSYYESKLFEELPYNGDVPWVVPVGIYHRSRLRLSMQYCPRCLYEDDAPYYRKAWRTALCVICPDHRCLLLDCCAACKSPIMFHRHGIGRSRRLINHPGRICSICLASIGDANATVLDTNPSIVSEYAKLISVLDGGGSNFLKLTAGNELLLFRGIRILVALIIGRNGRQLRKVLQDTIRLEIVPVPRRDFEYQPIEVRLNCMLAVVWMLEEWPDRFICIINTAKLTRSRLTDADAYVPFWLSSVTDAFFNHGPIVPSEKEMLAAISYLIKSNRGICWQDLADITGLKRDAARRALKRWEESHDKASPTTRGVLT